MSIKAVSIQILSNLYGTGIGYNNSELAKQYYGSDNNTTRTRIRRAIQMLRLDGYNVIKRMTKRGEMCKYYITKGIAEDVLTRPGRPPFTFTK